MDEGLLEAARTIRPYLGELVGAEAPRFDAEIAGLLVSVQSGQDVASQLRLLLDSNEATAEWVAEVLEDPLHRPPDLQPLITRGYAPLPRSGGPVHAGKYSCPDGDYVWYRRSVGVPVPRCPTHGHVLDLVLISG
jgi:hypothetical protein